MRSSAFVNCAFAMSAMVAPARARFRMESYDKLFERSQALPDVDMRVVERVVGRDDDNRCRG